MGAASLCIMAYKFLSLISMPSAFSFSVASLEFNLKSPMLDMRRPADHHSAVHNDLLHYSHKTRMHILDSMHIHSRFQDYLPSLVQSRHQCLDYNDSSTAVDQVCIPLDIDFRNSSECIRRFLVGNSQSGYSCIGLEYHQLGCS